ncbi:30S ribosomal protein S4 [Neolewinella antarctica]|uniref:Small ribosomal subunit protein uS4 n=1 Tax=Neolewinella antarctica TaxID=442734 RepID=A0ABX0X8N0_9BACT|nr:30S ribosomal protein S4 [Neolewinella antarctica]NJC25385.1 small subunit ribosomal protein S4 [Neolewinella antarctica]
MARYTGPKAKKARALDEPIFGYSRAFERKKYKPGQHGNTRGRRRQPSDYKLQLTQKQIAKFTYGVLERQFRNLFEKAQASRGVTGEVLLQLLEARLDNVVYRLGLAPTRRAARQLVSHRHIMLNGRLNNVPSTQLRIGDTVSVRPKSQGLEVVRDTVSSKSDVRNYGWLSFDQGKMEGSFLAYPERENIPEKINTQLIVELYSK